MPIIDRDGRPFSARTVDEDERMLAEEIAGLTADEQEVLRTLVAEAEQGRTDLVDIMAEAEYERIPVDPLTFLTDPYYLGETGASMWPKLREDFVDLFNGGYTEAIMGGSLGAGKSYFVTTALAYILYQMSCLRDPQRAYGIDPGSYIYIAILAKTEKVARRVPVEELLAKINRSPYFEDVFPHKTVISELEIRFHKKIMVVAGSTASSATIGLNIFAGMIDEAAFMGTEKHIDRYGKHGTSDRSEVIYKAITRRMKSRFQRSGKLPGCFFLVSSKDRPSAFIETRIREAKTEADPSVFVRERATWDVKPREAFSAKTFSVVVGNDRVRSKVLASDKEAAVFREMGCHVIEVPEDYRKDFERDPEGSIKDIAGIATEAVSPFIHRVEAIGEAEDPTLPRPLVEDEWVAGTRLEILWRNIAALLTRKIPGGFEEEFWRPRRHPNAIRYVHIDPSLTGDSTGLTMAHVASWTEVVRRAADGNEYVELAPIIETDLMLRVIPPAGDEILLSDVRSIVYQFQEHGFQVGYVSMDSYQSADGLQQFRRRGVEAEVVSVDRTRDPYDTLKTCLYEHRLRYYPHKVLQRELHQLQRTPAGKIDHPATGTKDVADSLAGSVFSLTIKMPGRPIPMTPGLRTGRDEAEDHSWVTGGKVPVSSADPRPVTKRSVDDLPMPFTKG